MRSLAHIPTKTVTSGYRAIKDGSRYNSYFPPPDERDRVIIKDGEVTDTVELMEKVVWKYLAICQPRYDFRKLPICKGLRRFLGD